MSSNVNESGRDNGSDVTITPSQNENAVSESLYSPLCPLCKLGFSWALSVICQRMRRITPVFRSTSGIRRRRPETGGGEEEPQSQTDTNGSISHDWLGARHIVL